MQPFELYSGEAEQAVLGSMLAQPIDVMDSVLASLRAEDFFVPAHVEIFDAMRGMYLNKVPIDIMLLHQRLADEKLAEAVGSPDILGDLLTGFVTHLNVGSYIQIVKHKSLLRILQAKCSTIIKDIADNPDDVAGIIDRAEKSIIEVAEPDKLPSIRDATQLTAAFEEHLGRIQRGESLGAVKTHYSSFDRINGGLKTNGFHVIGARSGMGKTTAMLNLAENFCKNGTGVGMISLEMDHIEYMTGIYAFMADINSRAFKAQLNDEQRESVAWATKQINGWSLQVDDCSLVDINRMRHICRKMAKEGADVLMIDYLQLIESEDEGAKRTRADQVSAMSRAIKLLSRELRRPIIVGAQLNRQAADDMPSLHHLRESGAVEQDADVVLLLRQKDPKDKSDRPIICWNFAKWRGGRAGLDLDFVFDKSRNRFHETTSTESTT